MPSAPLTEIAVAVVARDGRYLIGLRPPGAPLAGLWEFPGGKVRRGESPAAAAARECLEETGLRVTVHAVAAVVDHDYAHGRLRLHFLHCTSGEASRAVPERFRWVAAEELASYEFPAANASVIEQLRRRAD